MAKKPKPLIAPRRPPPAATPAELEDFIQGREAGPPQAPTDVHGRLQAPEPGAESSPPAVQPAPTNFDTAPVLLTGGEATADIQKRPETSTDVLEHPPTSGKPRGLVEREGGRLRRRRTIYLPPDLDERLDRWCAEQGREVSHAVAEAIRRMLAGHP